MFIVSSEREDVLILQICCPLGCNLFATVFCELLVDLSDFFGASFHNFLTVVDIAF